MVEVVSEAGKQVEQEGDHRAESFSGSELIDQPLARRTGFWRRIGSPVVSGKAGADTAMVELRSPETVDPPKRPARLRPVRLARARVLEGAAPGAPETSFLLPVCTG
jgi:hypothetical protein